jgi:hypothetical protein
MEPEGLIASVNNSPPLVPTLSQIKPVHIITAYF